MSAIRGYFTSILPAHVAERQRPHLATVSQTKIILGGLCGDIFLKKNRSEGAQKRDITAPIEARRKLDPPDRGIELLHTRHSSFSSTLVSYNNGGNKWYQERAVKPMDRDCAAHADGASPPALNPR